jgi:pimeloyl-ACP methyl ester carboxylesterase
MKTDMAADKDKTVSVWGDKVHPKVRILGDGPPVVYLHGGYGPIETELLDELAKSFTVYAPEHPGITAGDEDSYKALDDMWDLVLYYYDLFDKLGLKSPAVVGHSFGGMIAGEIAATDPTRVGKLVLISPLGLWRDDSPIRNYIVTPQTDLPALLFKDQHHPSLKRITLNPEDQQGFIRITWALGCTGKFMWPIPDKGLRKRLHRIAAPTLIVWGKDDKLLPAVYADEFRKGIPGAKIHLVDDGAHMMPLEEPAKLAASVSKFIKG